jgi:hypothetical protein
MDTKRPTIYPITLVLSIGPAVITCFSVGGKGTFIVRGYKSGPVSSTHHRGSHGILISLKFRCKTGMGCFSPFIYLHLTKRDR